MASYSHENRFALAFLIAMGLPRLGKPNPTDRFWILRPTKSRAADMGSRARIRA